jgi:hypothetical protein
VEEASVQDLVDTLLSMLAAQGKLEPMSGFADIESVRTLDGRHLGTFRALAGGRVAKAAVTHLRFAPGAEYTYFGLLPQPRYRIPWFVCDRTIMGNSITFSVDLYPALDLSAEPAYFARYRDRLEQVYEGATKSEGFSWRPSSIAWVRAIGSPYFFMSTVPAGREDAIAELVSTYFRAWLEFYAHEEPVGPDLEALIRTRRERMAEGLLAWDPHGARVVQVLGQAVCSRLFNAMLKA